MGEALRDFDPSLYYARKPVLALVPGLGLGKMMEAADKYAKKYWGIDKGLSIAPIPDDMTNRLIQFRKILLSDYEIDPVTYDASRSTTDMIHRGERALSHHLTLQKSRAASKKSKAQPRISITYAEALEDPQIMMSAYNKLLDTRDSVAKTIAALEHWRLSDESHVPTTSYLKLGIETYEIALLSLREEQTKEAIAELAVAQHVVVYEQ